ncbi:MAG: PKD domain-containing protein, partial [Planctomycetota bacterium]
MKNCRSLFLVVLMSVSFSPAASARGGILDCYSHNPDLMVVPGGSYACTFPPGSPFSAAQQWMQPFTLAQLGVMDPIEAVEVRFPIDELELPPFFTGLDLVVTLCIDPDGGEPGPVGTLEFVTNAYLVLPPDAAGTTGVATGFSPHTLMPGVSYLVIIELPFSAPFIFQPGANDGPAVANSYVVAPTCGINEPVDLSTLAGHAVHLPIEICYDEPTIGGGCTAPAGLSCNSPAADEFLTMTWTTPSTFVTSEVTIINADTLGTVEYEQFAGTTTLYEAGPFPPGNYLGFVRGFCGPIVSDTASCMFTVPPCPGPVPSFTSTSTAGFAPLTVTFSCTTTIVGAGDIAWDFTGDGIPDSNGADIQFVFGASGTYSVTLTVTDFCGAGSSTYTDFLTVYETAPIQIHQLNFRDALYSQVGEVTVDLTQLGGTGYFNIVDSTTQAWLVQNMPLFSPLGDFSNPTITTRLDLSGFVAAGTPLAGLSVLSGVSPLPAIDISDVLSILDPTPVFHLIGQRTLAIGGVEDAIISLQDPPFALPDTFETVPNFLVAQPNHPNVQAGFNQCAPSAVANSLQYLENRFQVPVTLPNVPGFGPDGSLVGHLETLMGRSLGATRSTQDSTGVWPLRGKLKYLAIDQLGDYVSVHHMGGEFAGGGIPLDGNVDFTEMGITSHALGSTFSFDVLLNEIQRGSDVELDLHYQGGGRHYVEVVGAGYLGGKPFILHVSDKQQADKDPTDSQGTTDVDFEFIDPATGRALNSNATIDQVIFERPRPVGDTCGRPLLAFFGEHRFDTELAITDGPAFVGGFCGASGTDDQINNDLYFVYISDQNSELSVSAALDGASARLAVYSAGNCPPLASDLLACSEASSVGDSASVTIYVSTGQQYYFRVGSNAEGVTSTGTLTIAASCPPITNLECSYFAPTDDVILTWQNGTTYWSID